MHKKTVALVIALLAGLPSAFANEATEASQTSFATQANSESFAMPRARPTIVTLKVEADVKMQPDQFIATVGFDDVDVNEKELTKRSNATAAAIKKILSHSKDIQVVPSADGKKNVQSVSCLSNGFCSQRNDKVHIHNEVILSSASEGSLTKALNEIKKLKSKEPALIASDINPIYDFTAHEKAHMQAVHEGKRLIEKAAASLAKDGEKWHIVAMQFEDDAEQCPMMPMMMGGMQHPPMDAQIQNMMSNAQPSGQHGQQHKGNTPASVTLKVRATIALYTQAAKN
jgi:hypothetical protein